MSRYVLGNALPAPLQQAALGVFGKDRFTGQHRPKWLNEAGSYRRNGPPDFADDAEWLAHTEFPVSASGDKLRLARNGLRPKTHYLRDASLADSLSIVTIEQAETGARALARLANRPVWVQVEGQRVGDTTYHRPTTGLPHMWRVATPTGDIF